LHISEISATEQEEICQEEINKKGRVDLTLPFKHASTNF
jgi:hypothetical protein